MNGLKETGGSEHIRIKEDYTKAANLSTKGKMEAFTLIPQLGTPGAGIRSGIKILVFNLILLLLLRFEVDSTTFMPVGVMVHLNVNIIICRTHL